MAHATLVRGALVTGSETPRENVPLQLRLALLDPNEIPVQDAVVLARFTPQGQGTPVIETRFIETDDAGTYRSAPVTFPQAGSYHLLLRDHTYPQEEARAEITFEVGGKDPKKSYIFLFPPTNVGGQNVSTWLLYVVLLPLGAALIVTLGVLLSPSTKTPSRQN